MVVLKFTSDRCSHIAKVCQGDLSREVDMRKGPPLSLVVVSKILSSMNSEVILGMNRSCTSTCHSCHRPSALAMPRIKKCKQDSSPLNTSISWPLSLPYLQGSNSEFWRSLNGNYSGAVSPFQYLPYEDLLPSPSHSHIPHPGVVARKSPMGPQLGPFSL